MERRKKPDRGRARDRNRDKARQGERKKQTRGDSWEVTGNVRARQTVVWDSGTVAGGVRRTEVGPGKTEPVPRIYHAGCGGWGGRSVSDLREASTGKQPEEGL